MRFLSSPTSRQTGYRCDLPSVGYAIARDVEALLSYSWEGADA